MALEKTTTKPAWNGLAKKSVRVVLRGQFLVPTLPRAEREKLINLLQKPIDHKLLVLPQP
jgi:hypothetical protein